MQKTRNRAVTADAASTSQTVAMITPFTLPSMPKPVPTLTFGIEEEFFLVDPETRDLCGDRTPALLSACRARLGDRVHEELHRAQIEIATPVLHTASMAYESLHELRHAVTRIANKLDLQPLASGTHPFASWRAQEPTDKARYERLMSDYAAIGRRSLVCGLHVHVSVPEGVDRIALMNRLLPWLPLFLALSCSSPFWRGQPTGLSSYRQAAYDEWPRAGLPDAFADDADYARFLDTLRVAGAARDGSEVWWAIRPSSRFPTLELRICDACTRIEDTLALASAFRCLVRAHLRDPRLGAATADTPCGATVRRIVDENRWRAKRHGLSAEFIDPETGATERVADAVARLCALIAPDVASLRCEREIEHLQSILDTGTSADAQLAIYRQQRDALHSREIATARVTDWLVETTAGAGDGMRAPLKACL